MRALPHLGNRRPVWKPVGSPKQLVVSKGLSQHSFSCTEWALIRACIVLDEPQNQTLCCDDRYRVEAGPRKTTLTVNSGGQFAVMKRAARCAALADHTLVAAIGKTLRCWRILHEERGAV